ncbi:MAG: adenylate kinase [Clostridia bacterium]
MRLILLGAPGSGKGTQATKLSAKLGIPQISTGDIFRKNIKEHTALGLKVQQTVDSGGLVDDDLVIQMVIDRLNQPDAINGYILDGFPRSIPQAIALDQSVKIDYVLNLSIDKQIVINRMASRRTCSSCGSVYNANDLRTEICNKCGGQLITRLDDKPESVTHRLEVYEQTTRPMIDYYSALDRLYNINANATPEQVFSDIMLVLGK